MAMVDTAIGQADTATQVAQGGSTADPASVAASIIERAQTENGGLDFSQMRRDIAAVDSVDVQLGAQVRELVEAQLSPVERGELARAEYTLFAQGRPVTFSEDGMTVAQQFESPAGSAAREQYNQFDQLYGDGDLTTFDGPAIEDALRAMQGGHALFDLGLLESGLPADALAGTPANGTDTATLVADLTQMGIDLVGIIDPTGLADGANALISLGRAGLAVLNGEGGEALGHLGNGALSAISIVPLGDLAKAGKIGRWADTITSAIRAASESTVVREAVQPLLREIADNLNRIPQNVMDSLPQGARESLERMRTELDEFLGTGARQADGSSTYTATVRGQQVVLENIDIVSVNYVKRDRATYNALRQEFNSGVRADFLQSLTTNPDNLAALRRAGFDDAAIERIASGRVPQGWQVHHKLPLDDGGTNAFDNLVLIRNDPQHIALTNAQRELVGDLEVGQSRQIDFPVPPGVVYPAQ